MRDFFRRLFGTEPKEDFLITGHTADTFVEATDGGWGDPPDAIPTDGGSQKDYVTQQLELAKQQAQGVEIGESFEYTLTNIPVGIAGPHEIAFGMMMRATDYGLEPGMMTNEKMLFTRRS